jgi:hypothetical protein
MKIERKTPLDAMVRRNHQMKKQAEKMPTYGELQRIPSTQQINPIMKPSVQSTFQQQHQNQQQERKKAYQRENHSLYPRYTPQHEKPKLDPPLPQTGSYLRAQMLKELRSQQDRQPIQYSQSRLKPPQVTIPPIPAPKRHSPPPSSTPQTFVHENSVPFRGSSYYKQPEPEIIDETQMINCLQNIQDRTKIDVLLKLLDGHWHTDAELIRIAKKTRDFIGVVGFGMLIASFEDTIAKSFLVKKINPGNTSEFKINENFIELARTAYSQYKKSE